MWLHRELAHFETIVKITRISANYLGEDSYITIMCDEGDSSCIHFDNDNCCRAFFQELRQNLSNPNKIFRHGQIEDL